MAICNANTCGGWVIVRPDSRIYHGDSSTHGLLLQSDHHIGAHDADYEKMQREWKEAKEKGYRIILNGDLFDGIFPFDHKRFTPDTLHPYIRGRRDVMNATIDMAVELLAPYVENIDMIGSGNHEGSIEKYHSADIVMLLLDKLHGLLPKDSTHSIAYGGRIGYVSYRYVHASGGNVRTVNLFYFHGAGGSAPVTKGMIDFNRVSTYVDADVIWLGHKHNRFADTTPQRIRCPKSGAAPKIEPVIHVMTGGYRRGHLGQTQEQIREHGRQSTYATDMGLAPQGTGGIRLMIHLRSTGNEIQVIQ